jgi:hypothetical protein
MAIKREFAVTAVLAGLAVGTASNGWADTTMSGPYTAIDTSSAGRSTTSTWSFAPCGDECANVDLGNGMTSQARFANGQWVMDVAGDAADCGDGTQVPGAQDIHYSWDANTLAGTAKVTYTVPACGHATGTWKHTIQLRQAP